MAACIFICYFISEKIKPIKVTKQHGYQTAKARICWSCYTPTEVKLYIRLV